MEFVWFLLIGLCAGWLAGQFSQRRGFGLVGNLIIGVIGAILGGFLFNLLGFKSYTLLGSLITATIGALILLFLLDIISRAQKSR